ncbi:MAG: hypothetical protein ACRD0G_03845 [Acidimicrobiales bacterium]
MALVVDDHVLIDLLADNASDWLREEMSSSAIYTTGSWYYRLASAARRGSGSGTLSGRLARLVASQREAAQSRIERLPEWIGLLGSRLLVPVMASLDVQRTPNFLTADALATALVVDGSLAVTVDSPLMHSGAADLGIPYRLVV